MIYAECTTEKVLVSLLNQKVKHVGGKTRVLKRLEKDEDGVGLIDEDPGCAQPPLLESYIEISDEEYMKCDLKILSRGKNKLVVLCPCFEEWMLKTSEESGVNPQKYNLPSDPDGLHEIAGSNIPKLKEWITEIIKVGGRRIRKLIDSLTDTSR